MDVLEESTVNKDNTISDSFLERAITTYMSDNDNNITSEDLNQDGILQEKPNQVEIEFHHKANDENNVNAVNQKVRKSLITHSDEIFFGVLIRISTS